ncbi:MAG: hypothetical protein GY804_02565 [Alphaproteobacteria bacterium]|nr:hypothetical protein [Alphaproteobacteria bacterium]
MKKAELYKQLQENMYDNKAGRSYILTEVEKIQGHVKLLSIARNLGGNPTIEELRALVKEKGVIDYDMNTNTNIFRIDKRYQLDAMLSGYIEGLESAKKTLEEHTDFTKNHPFKHLINCILKRGDQ